MLSPCGGQAGPDTILRQGKKSVWGRRLKLIYAKVAQCWRYVVEVSHPRYLRRSWRQDTEGIATAGLPRASRRVDGIRMGARMRATLWRLRIA